MAIAYSLFFVLFLVIGLLFSGRVILFKTGLIYAVKKWWRIFEEFFHVYQLFKVPEFNESMQENQLYRKVYVYLNSLASMEDSNYTNLFTGKKSNDIILRLDPNQIIDDDFLGARVSWINYEEGDIRTFVLKIRKADKRRILRPYLQHIHTVSDELEEQNKDLKLYMNTDSSDSRRNRRWTSVPFKHPATFDTIAMESDLKNKVKADLESFVKAKQYYHRLGRVWKRSYLLYGPSGTGKSSFVAAMANFLGYDVYDIDLSKVREDSDLKMLLLQATTKSVIVIEDLDRFLTQKSSTVSLSGILNFMDGLLNSCCAEERIMVATMNNKDQIDPAILRPGRIDVHIHFPVCDFSAFKHLASSYLGLKDHKLFPQVEEVFNNNPSLSPAEIGELMIANRSSPSRALKTVINALQSDVGRRLSENLARKSMEECEDHSGIFRREGGHTIKEVRKFVDMIRMKSGRKSQSFDLASPQRKEG
ncbi:P-loop containing nucleoside triphosphate hydrolases superfamily protein [Tripterygium wilfordii]|uniref:P-loop containing nucleoside triphosphate hydrolases superfamily protein n=1 Tax=Tripterygium wilfordii TaxID=458696 RepID=A0A7J7CCX7_TRIWF|nr:AAA-ATPase At2g46620-like [Tripterygium wilfordii]KAF5731983.1 P-loop containing nucleoside triphosphate hydrolases superfamily protein [Tripterygium wilfordii]